MRNGDDDDALNRFGSVRPSHASDIKGIPIARYFSGGNISRPSNHLLGALAAYIEVRAESARIMLRPNM